MEKEFIIIKHPLKIEGNIFIQGIRFCEGVAVVQKNSKMHSLCRTVPTLKKHRVLSLDWLGKFGFGPHEIKIIYGNEVYNAYMRALEEKKKETQALKEASDNIPKVLESSVDNQEVLTESNKELTVPKKRKTRKKSVSSDSGCSIQLKEEVK
jgi:hypothetical protein